MARERSPAGRLAWTALVVLGAPWAGGLLASLTLIPIAGLGFMLFWCLGALIGDVAAATIGLVWHAYARRRGWVGARAYALAGAAAGLIIGAGIVWTLWGEEAVTGDSSPILLVFLSLWGALNGALTAWIAWLLRRPDRDVTGREANLTNVFS
jgi:hypothetical protein